MKKILIFSTAYLPLIGGAEVAIKELTDRLADFDFDLITARLKPGLPKLEKIGRINVYRLGFGVPILDKLFLPFSGAVLTLRLNRENCYEYFWCMMATFAAGAAYLANIIRFWRPTPIILTLQEGDSEEHFKKRWFGMINLSWRLALKKTKILTVISAYLAERARKFGYKGEIQIIPNGVDLNKFKVESSKLKVKELKNKLGISENEKVIITVSRLVEKNGVGDLIESMGYLSADVKLIIIGGGELEADLKSKIADLKLSDRVIMLGSINNQALPQYLAAADIFVRPSLSEGQGISFLEAMAAGVPIIATPVGGIVDFLRDGETGWFCGVKDPHSIAEKIKYVFDERNKDKVREVVNKAKEMVEKTYDWDLIAEKMKTVFK